MTQRARSIDNVVAFQNSQGLRAQGTLMDLTRHVITFEVYNPYSIVQLSEVLQTLQIRQGEREIYRGRAVVTNLINTGMMVVVTASLVDSWSDLAGLRPGPALRDAVDEFLQDWSDSTSVLTPEYHRSVGNLRSFLQELSRWIEHGEGSLGVLEANALPDLVEEFLSDVDGRASNKFADLYGEWEAAIKNVPKKHLHAHKAYARHELHPFMLCSPFVHRAFTKPLGYGGDYIMVRMMLSPPWEGPTCFARIVNASSLRHDAPAAHRNRIDLLTKAIASETRRIVEHEGRLEALNIGCGPAVEVEQFIRQTPLADHANFTLIDFNEETIQYAGRTMATAIKETDRKTELKTEKRAVDEIIRESMRPGTSNSPQYDLVYCAGLFDYFGDPTCEALLALFYSWTKPGGLVVTTNVTPGHSTAGIMSHLMDWNLRLRDERKMLELAPPLGIPTSFCDATGVNVFLTIRRPSEN